MNAHAGVDVGSVVQAGHTFTNTDKIEKREDTLDKMTKQMDRSAQFSSLQVCVDPPRITALTLPAVSSGAGGRYRSIARTRRRQL